MKTILCLIVCALGHKKIPLLRGIETLVAEGGFEPSTHGLWFHRSNQLSYSAILCQNLCQGYANFRLDSNDSYLLSQQDFTNPNRRQCCNKPVFLISSVASYKSSARDYDSTALTSWAIPPTPAHYKHKKNKCPQNYTLDIPTTCQQDFIHIA